MLQKIKKWADRLLWSLLSESGATVFPGALDSYSTKNAGDVIQEGHVNDLQDAGESMEAKIGVDGSAVAASHDYKLLHLPSYDQNVMIHAKSNTEIDVDANILSVEDTKTTAVNVTINAAVTGANGLDAGALGATTWYYVWAIYNTTTSTVAGLLSASIAAPTMPAGYAKKRLIGYAKTDGASDLLKSYQFMNEFMWDIPTSVVSDASAGAWSAAVPCSGAIPSGVRMGIFGLASSDDDDASTGVWIRPNGSTWSTSPMDGITTLITGAPLARISGQRKCALDSSQQIQYRSDAGDSSTDISVEGFICGLF